MKARGIILMPAVSAVAGCGHAGKVFTHGPGEERASKRIPEPPSSTPPPTPGGATAPAVPFGSSPDTSSAASDATCRVAAGQEFTVSLGSNPATGYSWQLGKSLDATILKLAGTRYETARTGLLGAGGKETWTFQAVSAGQTTISLNYVRPWEKDVPPARTHRIAVAVS
jgi:inhibitor of cysteine peptidase